MNSDLEERTEKFLKQVLTKLKLDIDSHNVKGNGPLALLSPTPPAMCEDTFH